MPKINRSFVIAIACLLLAAPSFARTEVPMESISAMSGSISDQVIAWRRDFHEHPELGNREFRTARIVAEHLQALGMEVQTGIAHTGVVGILKGGKPGPVVLLRADMDGLPVEERGDLPFRSVARGEYNGADVPVMHACGHDTHVAILMGAAEILSALSDDLPGTVKFVFQPAEEGPPPGEEGGAKLMVAQGVLQNPTVDAAFALHINAIQEAGRIGYSRGPRYASVDDFGITVHGKQAHGAYPWLGIDPILVSAQIVTSLQTIVSRTLPITQQAAAVTVGMIHGGVRSNIIPEKVEMVGTIRALDEGMRAQIHTRIREIAEGVAASMGATVEVRIPLSHSFPMTTNNPAIADMMVPVLQEIAGPENVEAIIPVTGAEDFAFISQEVPSLYIQLGGRIPGKPIETVGDHHTPDFYVDESGLDLGVQAMAAMAWKYLVENQP